MTKIVIPYFGSSPAVAHPGLFCSLAVHNIGHWLKNLMKFIGFFGF
jgi:hypothetical protein